MPDTNNNLILVKLGGSLITDKSKESTLREDVLKRLCKEIHEVNSSNYVKIVLGHGAGSFAHVSAKKYRTNEGYVNNESKYGLAVVGNDAVKLNRMIIEKLLDAGENAISLSTFSISLSENGKITDFYDKPLKKCLEEGMLPVLYGDVGFDTEKGCRILSTDDIFLHLGPKLKAKKIIMCGKTDGVFTGDPVIDPESKLIPEITRSNYEEIKHHITGSDGIADVTGGMLKKVEKSLILADSGIETWIINGMRPDVLKKAILDEKIECTIIK